MANIAVIEKTPSNIKYDDYFDFEYDLYQLCSKKQKKILKKDIDIDFDSDAYEYVVLIGAEPTKEYAKVSSVVTHQGTLINEKFIPITSPAMLAFKPAGKPAFEKALENLKMYVNGFYKPPKEVRTILIEEEDDLEAVINYIEKESDKYIALDSETSGFYPRTGFVLGISITITDDEGFYISSDILDDEVLNRLQKLWNKKTVVFHNAKFDMHFFKYHFNWTFPQFEDSILLHYCLDEQPGTHGLKDLAIKYTELGDYEKDLDTFKRAECKRLGIKLADFTYDLIPFDILGIYAAKDSIATWELFHLFFERVKNSKKLNYVYEKLLKDGTKAMMVVEDNGVPFKKEKLLKAQVELGDEIENLKEMLYSFDSVHKLEKQQGKIFNPNSVAQLRVLLFEIEGLHSSGKRTAGGELSTDAEVLEELSTQSALAEHILNIRKLVKIKTTYVDKVLLHLDTDGRLRTNFNLFSTTSGRLSSSGTLNMQQLPRKNKIVKACIEAAPGWKIISQDLKTAEMYIVSVLSGDKKLQGIFKSGGDYHGYMATLKYGLKCDANEVATLYPEKRQDAKTISFEILYKLNFGEEVLKKFPTLMRWLKKVKAEIEGHGYVYQFFGRKRRLPNVFSSNSQEAAHEVRSGVNSLVQGPSSDVNLLACIEMVDYIQKVGMKAKIFGLVHDSILAEVPDEEIEQYTKKLAEFTQKDRGLSIPGSPIGLDLEIGQDYSFQS